jgi:hypothetical protein
MLARPTGTTQQVVRVSLGSNSSYFKMTPMIMQAATSDVWISGDLSTQAVLASTDGSTFVVAAPEKNWDAVTRSEVDFRRVWDATHP